MTAVRLGLALLAAAPAFAQWINYPTPGTPRLPDGTPNLAAPAPKTADGKPDLSGVWEHKDARDSAYYLNGIDIPWQLWAKALFQRRTEDNQIDNPESRCLPRGLPKADAFDIHKIVEAPGLVLVLYEYQNTFRQIFTDGRALPKDPNPTWMGYSVGHWEGDTLVVESRGDALRLIERMHRRGFGHMDIEITIDDPKACTKPWKAQLHPELIPDTDLLEFVCNENERDLRHLVGK